MHYFCTTSLCSGGFKVGKRQGTFTSLLGCPSLVVGATRKVGTIVGVLKPN